MPGGPTPGCVNEGQMEGTLMVRQIAAPPSEKFRRPIHCQGEPTTTMLGNTPPVGYTRPSPDQPWTWAQRILAIVQEHQPPGSPRLNLRYAITERTLMVIKP